VLLSLLLAACGAPARTTPPPTARPAVPQSPEIPRSPPVMRPLPGVLAPSRTGKHELVEVGDSLTAFSYTWFARLLPGWTVHVDGLGGRPLFPDGINILASYEFPADGSVVLAMPLFTNDDPTRVRELQAAVEESLRRVGPNGCVVWATIHRPPVRGHSYARANQLLRAMAALDHRIRLVDWARAVVEHHIQLDKTGVHPLSRHGAPGWKLRGRLMADAVRSC
jgi:hypothetical protein